MKSCLLSSVFAAGAIVVSSGLAFATTTTTTATADMDVSATVQTACSIDVDGDIDFGSIDNTDLATSGIAAESADVTVTCGAGDDVVSVTVDGGGNYDAGYRRMELAAGSEFINYILSTGASAGDIADGGDFPDSSPWSLNSSTFDKTNTVFVRIPSGQSGKSKGTYTDTVTFTATYTP